MAAKKKESSIREFISALEKRDVEKALTFFTDDAVWRNNEGTFKGKEKIKAYTEWMLNNMQDLTFTEEGIGLVIEGDKAVFQHIFEGIYEGDSIKAYGVCTYQFEGDKCKTHCTITDRLAMAQQAKSGPIGRKAVSSIVSRMEKGLR
jgi:ketosteroid isomerase-like protein